MTPAELLETLRERGYGVERSGGELVVRGSVPRHADRAVEALKRNKPALLELLRVEAHPAVGAVTEALNARLVDVRPATSPTCSECGKRYRIGVVVESRRDRSRAVLCSACARGETP